MKRFDLTRVLTIVAIVETAYAIAGLLTPPSLITFVTGWVLSPDGQWIAKLLGAALGSQALVAWVSRKDPHPGIVIALAGYQLVASTVDWLMWVTMADAGIFSTPLARVTVSASIVIHYSLGAMLLLALRRAPVPPPSARRFA